MTIIDHDIYMLIKQYNSSVLFDPCNPVKRYIEDIQKESSSDSLEFTIAAFFHSIGIRHFTISLRFDDSTVYILRSAHVRQWRRKYSNLWSNEFDCGPVFVLSDLLYSPLYWIPMYDFVASLNFAQVMRLPDEMLAVYANLGISGGWAMPIHTSVNNRSCCCLLNIFCKGVNISSFCRDINKNLFEMVLIITAMINKTVSLRLGECDFNLTEREQSCMTFVAEGLCSKNIAHELGISTPTVNMHINNAKRKLNVRTRAAAVRKLMDLPSK